VINLVILLVLAVLSVFRVWSPLTVAFNEQKIRNELPVDAVAWLVDNKPQGEIFNPYNWGGYLVWSLYPEYRVFVDGRTDLYGNEFLLQYLEVQSAQPGFEDILAEYDVNVILTYPDDVLSLRLGCVGGWEEVYQDDVAVIWVRRGAAQ
jgi:hypothetical protein